MSNRQIGTIVLVIAMFIVAISVLFTNNLARQLQLEEQKNMGIWADATQQLILADNDADIDFVSSIIEKNTTIPVYICDEEGKVLASRNVPEGKSSNLQIFRPTRSDRAENRRKYYPVYLLGRQPSVDQSALCAVCSVCAHPHLHHHRGLCHDYRAAQ